MNRLHWTYWKTAKTKKLRAEWLATLVKDNECLVRRFASRFLGKMRGPPDHLQDDVFQAARIGLLRAIQEWDPDKGAFSTVAHFLILKEMQKVMRHATPVTIPDDVLFPSAARRIARSGLQVHAAVCFVGPEAADGLSEAQDPESRIDEARAARALQRFLATLTDAQRRSVLSGKSASLLRRARIFVENATR